MKFLVSVLLSMTFLSVPVWADEEDDGFDCQSNDAIRNAQLECVTCGIQRYYQGKRSGPSAVVPSEKWLAFLAATTRSYKKLNPDGTKQSDESIIRSSTALQSFHWNIITQVQAYGFCTDFLGKTTKKAARSKAYRNLSSEDWQELKPFITGSRDPDTKSLNTLAKDMFGFADAMFSDKAQKNMYEFISDPNYRESSVEGRREVFRSKVDRALAPEYDVSGERTGASQIIQTGSDDQGMRECLEQIRDNLSGKNKSLGSAFRTGENYQFCRSMAKSCELQGDLCGPSVKQIPVAPPRAGKPVAPPPPVPTKGRGQHGLDGLPAPGVK